MVYQMIANVLDHGKDVSVVLGFRCNQHEDWRNMGRLRMPKGMWNSFLNRFPEISVANTTRLEDIPNYWRPQGLNLPDKPKEGS